MKRNDIFMLLAAGAGLYWLSRNKAKQASNDLALASTILPAAPAPDYVDRTTVDEFIAGQEYTTPTNDLGEWSTLFG